MPQPALAERRRAVAERISHYCVGLPLVLKGVDKAEHFAEHPFTVAFLIAAGAFVILGATFQHRIEKRIANFAALFHVAEGAALVLVGMMLLEKSARLPYFLLFAGAAYLVIGAFDFVTDAEAKKRSRPVFLAVMGTAFLLAAAVAIVLNLLHSNNAWAFITAGVIAAVGAFMLLVRRKAGE